MSSYFRKELIENEIIKNFFNHVRTQNWTQLIPFGESLASVYEKSLPEVFFMDRLFLDPAMRTYFSEFQKDYIRDGSLSINLINNYLKIISDL